MPRPTVGARALLRRFVGLSKRVAEPVACRVVRLTSSPPSSSRCLPPRTPCSLPSTSRRGMGASPPCGWCAIPRSSRPCRGTLHRSEPHHDHAFDPEDQPLVDRRHPRRDGGRRAARNGSPPSRSRTMAPDPRGTEPRPDLHHLRDELCVQRRAVAAAGLACRAQLRPPEPPPAPPARGRRPRRRGARLLLLH